MIKLPEPAGKSLIMGDVFTADQLKQAIRDALEEAAKVCDQMHEEDRPGDYAYAIRKLKEDIQ